MQAPVRNTGLCTGEDQIVPFRGASKGTLDSTIRLLKASIAH